MNPVEAWSAPLDTDPAQVAAAVETFGRLDVVVNLVYASVLKPIVDGGYTAQ